MTVAFEKSVSKRSAFTNVAFAVTFSFAAFFFDSSTMSKKNAAKENVIAKATFVKADLFETDFSKATVITMFLLPDINMKLRPKILNLKPGTRVVSNSFTMEDWEADQTETLTGDCTRWGTALLWIGPAKV